MKHKSVVLKGSALLIHWDNANRTAAEVAGLDSIEDDAMYEVSWPDHVVTPRYNGDCEIALIAKVKGNQ